MMNVQGENGGCRLEQVNELRKWKDVGDVDSVDDGQQMTAE